MSEQGCIQLTLFPGDSPASPSVWLESKKERGTTVISGLKCSELSENLRRVGLSVRMYLESCELPLPTLSRTWSVKAITSSCLTLKLRLSALRIAEKELHSSQTGNPGLWKTPVASDAANREFYHNSRGEPNLSAEVKLWPTPAARDYKGANSMEHLTRPGGGRNHMGQLANAVKMYPTPKAQNARGAGQKHGNGGPSLDAVVGGKLNPMWVEWLMGFPIGWTDLNA